MDVRTQRPPESSHAKQTAKPREVTPVKRKQATRMTAMEDDVLEIVTSEADRLMVQGSPPLSSLAKRYQPSHSGRDEDAASTCSNASFKTRKRKEQKRRQRERQRGGGVAGRPHARSAM